MIQRTIEKFAFTLPIACEILKVEWHIKYIIIWRQAIKQKCWDIFVRTWRMVYISSNIVPLICIILFALNFPS